MPSKTALRPSLSEKEADTEQPSSAPKQKIETQLRWTAAGGVEVVQSAEGSKRPPISPRQRVLSDMAALHAAATLYRLNQGNWPTSVRDLVEENLIGNLTADPWGGEYQIVPKEEKVEILSLGADGSEGGIGIEADIRYAP